MIRGSDGLKDEEINVYPQMNLLHCMDEFQGEVPIIEIIKSAAASNPLDEKSFVGPSSTRSAISATSTERVAP
jgi:hypothetical protein